jgi:hypothetical protein
MKAFLKSIHHFVFFLTFLLGFQGASLGGELIEPTRSLKDAEDLPGRLTVLSEPPGLEVALDGTIIGKTPFWMEEVKPGAHSLRIKGKETEIYVNPGKTLKISLFKGSFIIVPEQEKEVKKRRESTEEDKTEPARRMTPAKEPQDEGLTLWEKFINGTLGHF